MSALEEMTKKLEDMERLGKERWPEVGPHLEPAALRMAPALDINGIAVLSIAISLKRFIDVLQEGDKAQ